MPVSLRCRAGLPILTFAGVPKPLRGRQVCFTAVSGGLSYPDFRRRLGAPRLPFFMTMPRFALGTYDEGLLVLGVAEAVGHEADRGVDEEADEHPAGHDLGVGALLLVEVPRAAHAEEAAAVARPVQDDDDQVDHLQEQEESALIQRAMETRQF